MIKNLDQREVLHVAAHLIITLAIIGAYIIFAYLDKSTTSIENMLLIAVGFWFAAMNKTGQPVSTTNIQHADKVEQPALTEPRKDV